MAAEVCEALGVATEPRIVTPGRRPVMEMAGVPHELIRWTARRSDEIAACLAELEHEYVTAVDDDGELKFLPVVSERARAKMNQIAARKTRPPKQKTQPLAQLRVWWKVSAILTSKVAADFIPSLLEYARAAAAAIRVRIAVVVDVASAAVDVTATVFVMNEGGRFHRRHLLAEARRHLALVLRGRRRDPGLDEEIVAAAISTHCLDISEPTTTIGLLADYRLYTARWDLADLPARPRPPTPVPDLDRQPRPIPASRLRSGRRDRMRGSGRSPASRSSTTAPSSPVRWSARSCAPPRPPPCGTGRTTSSPTSRRRCPSSCSRPSWPTPSTTTRSRRPGAQRRST
ncbi:relaxase domain-containing protein [Streptomyces sp. NPDC031705]|uniref:relaxase domain-containing protein n=1 Tax=Streptomyces sp. NPDC031705 TaxID=3155729 RepID=UPI0033DA890F